MDLETQKLLYDILQAARNIGEFTAGLTFESFRGNMMAQAAVERKFEVIGEALVRLTRCDPTVLQGITNGTRIIGFRNIIAHGYDVVDEEIVWEAVQEHLPVLVREVEDLLKSGAGSDDAASPGNRS
jgi:uncharacterized protein with HEPN domain